MVDRLMRHENQRKESIEKARKAKQEQEEQRLLELKKMHKGKKETEELKECFNRLAGDAKIRDNKMQEAKNK